MIGDVLKRECRYETVMYQVKRMLSVGLISEQEFQEIEARFRAKYKPISGGYIIQTDLLCARRRVISVLIKQLHVCEGRRSAKRRHRHPAARQLQAGDHYSYPEKAI